MDFYLAFSPERVDPGNETYSTHDDPEGRRRRERGEHGAGRDALRLDHRHRRAGQLDAGRRDGQAAREHVPRGEHRPGQRDCADVAPDEHRRLGSDRRGQAPSRSASCRSIPGPGLGGHCIPIDPFYLSWKARQSGFECRFIELAGHVNGSMPAYVVERVGEALNTVKKADQRLAASTCSASPTRRTSATCASRRRSTSSSCCTGAARS